MQISAGVGESRVQQNAAGANLGLCLIGLFSGAAIGLTFVADSTPAEHSIVRWVLAGIVTMMLVVGGWALSARWIAASLAFSPRQTELYRKYDAFAAGTLLLVFCGAFGVTVFGPMLACLAIVAIGARAIALLAVMEPVQRGDLFASQAWLVLLFLISGFAALIYQIVWERVLFAAFGVNIESITIIVSLFMFGLGIGSLAGGLVAKRFANHVPLLFVICEVSIGLFGLVSLPLIHEVSRLTLHGSLLTVSAAVFALLCFPTTMMGATLPILVTHLHRHYQNLGRSVGLLYTINTLGSAAACFLTADLLFVLTGERGAITCAAACNFAVGILVSIYAFGIARRRSRLAPVELPASATPQPIVRDRARRLLVLFLAAATGYISLSQEMIWMRAVGFITGGEPTVFAHVLGCFLIGVAGGAAVGQKLCAGRFATDSRGLVRFIGLMLLISAAFYYYSISGVTNLMHVQPDLAKIVVYAIVAVVAMLLGGIFTVLCHYGARAREAVGITVSRIYLANIIGCTLGPLLTGFVLMHYFPTDRLILYLSAGTALLGGAVLLSEPRWKIAGPLLAAASAIVMIWYHPAAYRDFLAKLQFKDAYQPNPYSIVAENRSGIITIEARSEGGDIIYGGGMYDGRFNIDPLLDTNWIFRCYMIAALHRAPADVLEIGLSSASWTRVLADYGPIKRITTVEINGGYARLLRRHADRYPDQASVLDDPKVSLVTDDGRRWLNRNPDRRFDLILQNTTWHWRSEITNLLSVEYLELCKQHLNPGGVFYYNATQSDDVPYTAAHVFKHVVRVGNFIAASDSPFKLTPPQISENLMRFRNKGGQTFSSPNLARGRELAIKMLSLAGTDMSDVAPGLLQRKDLWLITDDNMATEFKRAKSNETSGADRTQWVDTSRSWWHVFRVRGG